MQVLLNLLSNAAKFLPPAGGRVEVRLQVLEPQGCGSRCSDNGSGVAAEQQALIFEKFRQGGDAANRPQGTGLGLPISRQIVEHFGGRMWLESGPGPGRMLRIRAAAGRPRGRAGCSRRPAHEPARS